MPHLWDDRHWTRRAGEASDVGQESQKISGIEWLDTIDNGIKLSSPQDRPAQIPPVAVSYCSAHMPRVEFAVIDVTLWRGWKTAMKSAKLPQKVIDSQLVVFAARNHQNVSSPFQSPCLLWKIEIWPHSFESLPWPRKTTKNTGVGRSRYDSPSSGRNVPTIETV